jgi:hypothetical protein
MINIDYACYHKLGIKTWLVENFSRSEYTLKSDLSIQLTFANEKNETFFRLRFGDVSGKKRAINARYVYTDY